MAAGNNVYSAYKDTDYIDGTMYDIFYAKELTEYASLDNIKALFYLDYLFPTTIAGENCFVGGVKVGTDNYYMHKETRLSLFAVRYNAEDFILCNDAGLNTYGKGEVYHLTSAAGNATSDTTQEEYKPRAGDCKLFINVKSAQYSASAVYLQYRLHGDTNFAERYIGNYPSAYSDIVYSQLLLDKKGIYDFRIRVNNEEGDRISTYSTLQVYAFRLVAKYNANYASYANSATATQNIYIKDSALTSFAPDGEGSVLYTNEECTNIAATGYYIINDYWYYFGYNSASGVTEVIRCNPVGQWESSDPAYVAPSANLSVSAAITAALASYVYPILNSASITISNTGGIAAAIHIKCKVNNLPSYTEYLYEVDESVASGSNVVINLPNLPFTSYMEDNKAKLTITITGNASMSVVYFLEDYI